MLKCCITTSSRVLGFTKPTMQLLSCTDRRFGQDSFMPSKVTQFLPKVFCILKCMGKFFYFESYPFPLQLVQCNGEDFAIVSEKTPDGRSYSLDENKLVSCAHPLPVLAGKFSSTCKNVFPSSETKWYGTRILLSIGRISLLYRTISVFLKFLRKYSKNPK